MITMAMIASFLDYSPETGELRWKVSLCNRAIVGRVAGTINKRGYRKIRLGHKQFMAHRIAFFIAHGREPFGAVDHINGDRLDNRIANLRECSWAENGQNAKVAKNNTSGYPGVGWHVRRSLWTASIRINRKAIHLGYFDSKEAAYAAYLDAKKRVHGFAPAGCNLPKCPVDFDPSSRRTRRMDGRPETSLQELLNPANHKLRVPVTDDAFHASYDRGQR